LQFKSSRCAPLNGPRGAEPGDHLQFEFHKYWPYGVGTITHGNVVVGYENGVFVHFGRDNAVTANLFIGTSVSIAVEDCQPIKADAWCDLALSDPDPSDTLISSLKAAMKWPLWSTVWMQRYPALRNVTWHPGATLNNTAPTPGSGYNSRMVCP
jgi:hypothetical protein